jgi:hypothetical protein
VVTIIVVFIVFYSLHTFDLYRTWRRVIENRERSTISTGVNNIPLTSSANPLVNPLNDNYTNERNTNENLPDAYADFTNAIQDSFSGYKQYNEKMTTFYNNVKKSAPQNLMTPDVLLPANDNW